MLEYPEGGQNTFVHRLPTRDQAGEYHAQARRHHQRRRCSTGSRRRSCKVQPADLLDHAAGRRRASRCRSWNFRNAYPVKWTGVDLNAGGTEIMTESLEIAHSGMTVMRWLHGRRSARAPRTSSRPSSRSTAARRSTATSTRPSTRSRRRNEWKYEQVTGTSFTEPKFGGGQPRQMELSLLFDQTFPPYKMTVREADRRAAGRDGGARRARPAARRPRSPPFVTFQWGALIFKGAMHEPDLRVQALPPRRRADPRRRQAHAQAGRPSRSRARTRPRARRPASASTASRTATRCRRSPTAPTATPRAGG